MSRLYDAVEPSVISEEMLLAAVKEQGPSDEKGKVSKHDGMEFDEVKSLRLDYQSECLLHVAKPYMLQIVLQNEFSCLGILPSSSINVFLTFNSRY